MTNDEVKNYRLDKLEECVDEIKNNHLEHIKKDISLLKDNQVTIKTDVAWLKRFFWIVATASIGSLIAGVINLL